MAVVPSGRFTKEGKPIYKAAPTQTDVRREAAEKRVQKFGSGGQKISDTGRVEVTVGGEKKWVTPEKALQVSSDKAKIEEAKGKIKRREKIEQTIRARLEREVEKASIEAELRGQKARKLAQTLREEVEGEPTEEVKPKKPLELFSPLAQERLGITGTKGGLLEVRKGERKVVVEPKVVELRKTFMELVEEPFKKKEAVRKEVIADVPITAKFRTGFESQLGTREPKLVGIKTPSGILTFKTIQEPITGKLKEAFRPSIEFFEERELELRRELRGRPSVIEEGQFKKIGLQEARTIQLRAGQLIVGGELGIRKQVIEQPLETGAIIATGAVFGTLAAKPVIAGVKAFRIGGVALGGAFAGITGFEAGVQIKRGKFVEVGKILGERTTEALLFVGAGKLAVRGIGGFKRFKFERGVRKFERRLPKFTEQELKLRLETGGIETRQVRKFPKEIQTTFDIEPRVKTAEEAVRIRILEKIKSPLKRPSVPKRVAIIPTERGPPILTLEEAGKFDVSAFGKAPKQFTRIRTRLGRVGDIKISQPGLQKILTEPIPKGGVYRVLRKPPKFTPPIEKPPKPFLLEPKLKTISKVEGITGRITPQEFAQQKGFLFIEPQAQRPRIDITQFGGKEIIPSGIITKAIIKPPVRVSPSLVSLGVISELGVREAQDIISDQKLRTRLEVSQKARQDLASDLERVIGTKPKPAFDIAMGLDVIQDVEPIQEQRQLLITIPKPRVPKMGRPGVPPPEFPIRPPPPPPTLIPLLPRPRLFLGDPIKRKKKPSKRQFAYTPDFIASVLNQFGPAPRQRMFTGQERRYKVRGKRFVSPLPKVENGGIFGLIRKQLEV